MPVPNGTATLVIDTTAPETAVSLSGTEGSNGWYVGDVTVTLAAMDNDGGSGVAKTEYSLDAGTTWQTYTGPVVITDEGVTSLRYVSTDNQGNREEDKILEVKIDKTAPEAKISFDPGTQKLDIRGTDNLQGDVSVDVATTSVVIPASESESRRFLSWLFDRFQKKQKKTIITATLADQVGHRTEVVLEKRRDIDRRIDLVLTSVSYDGKKTDIKDASLQYKWLLERWKKKYFFLASHLRDDGNTLESWYRPKKNETWIMERTRELDESDDDREVDRRPVRKKLPGLVVPYLTTEKGNVRIAH